VLYFKKPHLFQAKNGISISEIQTTPSDAAGTPQDVVVFSNKKTLTDIGYDVVHVGTIWLNKSEPVFLLKGFSCRACEPEVTLWVYNSQQKTTESFPYPGKRFLISKDADKPEDYDHMTEAVFGKCGGELKSLVIAQKHKEDNGQNWSYTTSTVSFSEHGNTTVTNLPENGFDKVKALLSSECQIVEPEDRNDYL